MDSEYIEIPLVDDEIEEFRLRQRSTKLARKACCYVSLMTVIQSLVWITFLVTGYRQLMKPRLLPLELCKETDL